MTKNKGWFLAFAAIGLMASYAVHAQENSAVAGLQFPESPPGAPQRPSGIIRAPWKTLPTGDQINRVYPKRAMQDEAEVRVVLRCIVNEAGKLDSCIIVSETPAGYGFGEAVMKLIKYFSMEKTTADGIPVAGATVTIPLRFAR